MFIPSIQMEVLVCIFLDDKYLSILMMHLSGRQLCNNNNNNNYVAKAGFFWEWKIFLTERNFQEVGVVRNRSFS